MGNEDLVGFVESLSGESHLRVQDDLGDGFVRLRAAEAQRRQAQQDIRSFEDVVLEMMRNSRDAGARTLFVATWKDEGARQLTIIDDGQGIPSSHHDLVFEPFVTSKLDSFHSDRWGVHGRGMALYSIRENVDEARIAASAPGLGSSFVVRADSGRLSEKKDQSTLPVLVSDDVQSGGLLLRGPHNIVRCVLEFAIDERDSMAVYFGSATEIAATLFSLSKMVFSKLDPKAIPDKNSVPYFLRLYFAKDPADFATTAAGLGLPMSDRSARRIMDGQIEPKPTLLDAFFRASNRKEGSEESSSSVSGGTSELVDSGNQADSGSDARSMDGSVDLGARFASPKPPLFLDGVKLSHARIEKEDLAQFSVETMKAYSRLASSYYLEADVEPTVRVSKGRLTISIPLVDDD